MKQFGELALGLALLGLGGVDVARAQVLTPGTLDLVLSACGPTALGADVNALVAQLCGGPPLRSGGSEDCQLVAGMKSDIDPDRLILEVLGAEPELSCAVTPIKIVPRELLLRGNELVTACGAWSWTLELDPARPQSASRLDLLPIAGDPSTGTTRGLLHLEAVLRLRHEGSGETVKLPWNVDLDFLARYIIAEPAVPGTAVSNLELFAGNDDFYLSEFKQCGRWCLEAREMSPERSP